MAEAQAAAITSRLVRMKEDATYWLGLLMLAEGQDEAAVDYLQRMTLDASPDSRWTDAARINLAAALVTLGKPSEAAALLRADGSPQRFGSRLAAERLEAEAAEAESPAEP
jgi:TolA-binding protein